jgi:hypothetical protein
MRSSIARRTAGESQITLRVSQKVIGGLKPKDFIEPSDAAHQIESGSDGEALKMRFLQ